jgi:tetratricopeptide (TPR) repeat protein
MACGGPSDQSLTRGDRLLAAGDLDAAVAEYKLALRQRGDEPDVVLRLAHAYALRGDVDEALRHYRDLIARDSSYRFQAAADLSTLARQALSEGAPDNMARALLPVWDWGLGLVPPDLKLALAHHLWRDTDYARSLPLYLSALEEPVDDSLLRAPTLYYEMGRAYEALGGCRTALGHFERYLDAASSSAPEWAGARWHYGNCLFTLAQEDRAAGRPGAALQKLDRTVSLGVPQTVIDRAHLLRGELLLALGEPERALDAYEEVLRLNPARSGPLVQQAELRIRQIRFGHD